MAEEDKRRLVLVELPGDAFESFLTGGEVTGCVEGLPEGATFVRAFMLPENAGESVCFVFQDDSFDVVPEAAQIPRLGCVFSRAPKTCRDLLHDQEVEERLRVECREMAETEDYDSGQE